MSELKERFNNLLLRAANNGCDRVEVNDSFFTGGATWMTFGFSGLPRELLIEPKWAMIRLQHFVGDQCAEVSVFPFPDVSWQVLLKDCWGFFLSELTMFRVSRAFCYHITICDLEKEKEHHLGWDISDIATGLRSIRRELEDLPNPERSEMINLSQENLDLFHRYLFALSQEVPACLQDDWSSVRLSTPSGSRKSGTDCPT